MDRETRGAIKRATQKARKLLEADFAEQLEGTFDVLLSGVVSAKAGKHLDAKQQFQRDKIVASIEHKRAAGMKAADAVADYLRDAAFTTLNRFAALKMLEARDLVQECISKGDQSGGYKEYCGLAPGVALLPDGAGYRLYLESVFDELSTEVKVLFDRRDVASALWPRRPTLLDLIAILNEGDLRDVWSEDETIGWIYQYFNSGEERRSMRDASQAPRDSRELAVRNQFFTPRYVVQFLTDNTLGRIWYEMRGGRTALVDRCEYMWWRPDGTYAPRATRDPRDLCVLDPACGSGHFLLYAFELLLTIYEEGWEDPEGPKSEATGRSLRDDYSDLSALRRDLPGMVLRHNLHGVDIDARCAQIAQFALWMRAQRAFTHFCIGRGERPFIRRSNVVVAEPLVGDETTRADFITHLGDAELARMFRELVERLRLAGDLGLLLRVEEILAPGPKRGTTGDLFAPVEQRIRKALAQFIKESSNNTQQRLFAGDAEQGVGLLETSEKKFDVVLMNPPFGYVPKAAGTYIQDHYPGEKNDVYAAFVARGLELLREGGLSGQLTSSTCFSLSHLAQFRSNRLLGSSRVSIVADLGSGVLDDAAVSTAAYVVTKDGSDDQCSVVDLRRTEDKATQLKRAGRDLASIRVIPLDVFRSLPGQPLAYTMLPPVTQLLASGATLGGAGADVNVGMMTGDDFRFLRTWWECRSAEGDAWKNYEKGNGFARFLSDPVVCVRSKDDFAEVSADVAAKYGSASRFIMNRGRYGQSGLVYTRIAKGFSVRFLPPGYIFSGAGLAIFPDPIGSSAAVCAFLNSRTVEHALAAFTDGRKWEAGYVRHAPLPPDVLRENGLADLALAAGQHKLSQLALDETTRFFTGYPSPGVAMRRDSQLTAELRTLLVQIDEASARLVGVSNEDSLAIDTEISTREEWLAREEDSPDQVTWEERRHSYLLGCAFGRWIPTSQDSAPSLELGKILRDGIPATPHALNRDTTRVQGILVDDPGATADVWTRLASIGVTLEPEESEEAYRLWLRSKAFDRHISLYSGCRRRAPIYWQLATPSRSYSAWLYLHSVQGDTLYQLQNEYVVPKLRHEEGKLESLRREYGPSPAASQRRKLGAQEGVVEELRAFLNEVRRVAPLWTPNLDDGVLINFAPLWRLVPQHKAWQRECKATWDALCSGEFDWAHLALHLWPERVVPKCKGDRSLAIAHGLEDVFWFEDTDGKRKPRPTPSVDVDLLIRERTSTAVKAALKDLMEASTVNDAVKGKRGGRKGKAAVRAERDA